MDNNNTKLNTISFLDIYDVFKRHKAKILIFNIIIILCSLFIALTLPDKFTSSAILKVSKNSEQNNSQGSLSSALGGLGLATGSSDQVLAVQTMQSRDILKSLLNQNENATTIFNGLVESNKEVELSSNDVPFNEIYESYRDILSINIIDTQFLEVSVTHTSGSFAFVSLSSIIEETNNILRRKSINKSENAISFLTKSLATANSLELKSSIGKLIDFHLRNLTLANVNDEFALEIVDSPYLPEEKSGPFRKLILLIGILLGLIMTSLILLILSRFSDLKS